MTSVYIGPDGMTINGTRVEVHADDLNVDFSTIPPTVRCTISADHLTLDLHQTILDAAMETSRRTAEQITVTNERLDRLTESVRIMTEDMGRSVADGINAAVRGRRGGGAR